MNQNVQPHTSARVSFTYASFSASAFMATSFPNSRFSSTSADPSSPHPGCRSSISHRNHVFANLSSPFSTASTHSGRILLSRQLQALSSGPHFLGCLGS
jgi:hypothetical protein